MINYKSTVNALSRSRPLDFDLNLLSSHFLGRTASTAILHPSLGPTTTFSQAVERHALLTGVSSALQKIVRAILQYCVCKSPL